MSLQKINAAVFYGPGQISNEQIYRSFDKRKEYISVKVNACAVCGYDVRVFRSGHPKVRPPVVLGHEICGEVDMDIKTTIDGTNGIIESGTRVAILPIIPCLSCIYCHNRQYNLCNNLTEIGSSFDGGFAEYVRIPERVVKIGGLVPVPDNLRDDEAALLEPLACCLNGFSHIASNNSEKNIVAIIGDGPIGLLHLQLSKRMYDAKTIMVGRIAKRISKAKSMGADLTALFNEDNNSDGNYSEDTLKNIMEFTNGLGVNAIMIATNDPKAFDLALKIASKNSKINIFAGMATAKNKPLDLSWLHYNQISITGSFSSTPDKLKKAAELVSTQEINLSDLITHRYSLNDIKQAIQVTEKFLGLRVIINRF
jgi:L-iditol 2-dehydrogenase